MLPPDYDQAIEDMWWTDRGFLPQQVDEMPFRRKHYLQVVLSERDAARAERQEQEQLRQDLAAEHAAKMAELERQRG